MGRDNKDENKTDVSKLLLESLLRQAKDESKSPEPPSIEANTFYAAAAFIREMNEFKKGHIETSNIEEIIDKKIRGFLYKGIAKGVPFIISLFALALGFIGALSEIRTWFSIGG